MRCVSYTRSVSGCPSLEIQKNAIGQQNEAIREYVKRKCWKLEQKYSDRKLDREADAAFLEMKKDGMERKFDCVVISSMFYCGKNITAAADVLYRTFYPFDIHFAVVEDDFCSAEVSAEEVEAYIKKARTAYRGASASDRATEYTEGKAYSKYGYVWVRGEELEIDPEAAAVVKEIFELCVSGKTARQIASILNERGLENPMQHRYRMLGKDTSAIKPGWKASMIHDLLDKKIFMGEWTRCVRGKTYTLPCPVIIEPRLFRLASVVKAKRTNIPESALRKKTMNPFATRIMDKETKHELNVYTQVSSRERIFRFRCPAPPVAPYEKMHISYSEVTDKVTELLAVEKEKARIAYVQIENGNAAAAKEKRQMPYREQAVAVFEQMAEVEKELMAYSRAYETEDMNEQEYKEKRECLMARQKEYDAKLQQNINAIKELETVFSLNNPWVQVFQSGSEDEPLTSETVKKYLVSIWVYRFQTVEIVTKHREWREKLPQEWFQNLEVK
jgi:DNA invertase Pin-like site-specific DNA recombinase